MTNLENVLKSKDIILPTKVCIVKAIVFLVTLNRYESWTIKKAERWRTDAFKLWCLRRLLRVPWRTWRALANPKDSKYWTFTGLILNTDWYWSWSSKTLATWCEEPTHWKRPWSWESLRARREGGDRGWHHWFSGHEFEQTQGNSEGQESLAWGLKELDTT